jgi:hypothetical protein
MSNPRSIPPVLHMATGVHRSEACQGLPLIVGPGYPNKNTNLARSNGMCFSAGPV